VVLRGFDAAARANALVVSLGVHAIGQLFVPHSGPLAAVRGLGMGALNLMTPLKVCGMLCEACV
jgi:hypothetical protein